MGPRGGAGQPKTHQDTVQPGATDVYSVVFSGGQLAEAGIAGDGSGDLDLLVYDENDHLVCRSTGSSDREYCRWWPQVDRTIPHRDPESGRCRESVPYGDELTRVECRVLDHTDCSALTKASIVSAVGRRRIVSLVNSSNSAPSAEV